MRLDVIGSKMVCESEVVQHEMDRITDLSTVFVALAITSRFFTLSWF